MGEFKRKLASIRKISEVLSIEGADNIELVKVDGWNCVTKKDEFQVGDLCIYFEIDSFLPILPELEFLRKSSYKKMCGKEGFRLKTIRLRGQLSQGLVLKFDSFFNNEEYKEFIFINFVLLAKDSKILGENLSFNTRINFILENIIGLDCTEILGIEKYDPPIPSQLSGIVKWLLN